MKTGIVYKTIAEKRSTIGQFWISGFLIDQWDIVIWDLFYRRFNLLVQSNNNTNYDKAISEIVRIDEIMYKTIECSTAVNLLCKNPLLN